MATAATPTTKPKIMYVGALPVGMAPSVAGKAFDWKEKENDKLVKSKIYKFLHMLLF